MSKNIAITFINDWKEDNPQDKIIHRDVGVNPPYFISQDWIAATFTPDEARTDEQRSMLSLSDTSLDELERADVILMSSPLINMGRPAALKAWFDQINHLGKTFTFELNSFFNLSFLYIYLLFSVYIFQDGSCILKNQPVNHLYH